MSKNVKLKKGKNYKNIKFIALFSVTFIMTLIIVSALFKNFSPPVDVNIGGEELSYEEDAEEFPERDIDDRLKWIQFEDNMSESPVVNEVNNTQTTPVKQSYNNALNNEPLEKVRPENEKTVQKYNRQEEFDDAPLPIQYSKPPVPKMSEIQVKNTQPGASVKMTKVYIGFYPTQIEADKVKMELGLVGGNQPYVKKINNNYIVQIGSFSDRNKALQLKNDLSAKGYPARLLSE